MQLGEVFLSLPAILTRDGVARVLDVPLDAEEGQGLQASAATLKRYISQLDISSHH
jgi:malate/lactate dehydrogenase